MAGLLALFLCTAAMPALADTLSRPSQVTAVTLYPWGANVTREVRIDAAPGQHEVIVPDLPRTTDGQSLRVTAEGATVGAVTLIDDRQPVADLPPDPAIAAARAEVKRLAAVVREGKDAVKTIRLRALAARDELAFLKKIAAPEADPAALAEMARQMGAATLDARTRAQQAEIEARAAEAALEPQEKALKAARKTLAALENADTDHAALSLALETAGAPATLRITTFTDAASWQPVYDLRLDRAAGRLVVDRGVLVSQASGEDWRQALLTLSTARPADRSQPSQVAPWLRRIGPKDAPRPLMATRAKGADAMMAPEVMAEPAPIAETAALEMMGATVTWVYPTPVDVRDGVEALRLKLAPLDLPAEIRAEAAPLFDDTAYVMADTRNDSAQVILPGPAALYLDGAMVGTADLPLTAAGDTLDMGFGPIDGLKITRRIPEANEGDRGLIARSNEMTETVEITAENLTGTDWPLRIVDRVPYATQEDLRIDWTAIPQPDVTDLDGRRGVMAWDSTLAAGASTTIRLETKLTWPADQVLR